MGPAPGSGAGSCCVSELLLRPVRIGVRPNPVDDAVEPVAGALLVLLQGLGRGGRQGPAVTRDMDAAQSVGASSAVSTAGVLGTWPVRGRNPTRETSITAGQALCRTFATDFDKILGSRISPNMASRRSVPCRSPLPLPVHNDDC